MLIDRVILPVLLLLMSLVFVLQFIPLWFYMLFFFVGEKIHPIYPPILITLSSNKIKPVAGHACCLVVIAVISTKVRGELSPLLRVNCRFYCAAEGTRNEGRSRLRMIKDVQDISDANATLGFCSRATRAYFLQESESD